MNNLLKLAMVVAAGATVMSCSQREDDMSNVPEAERVGPAPDTTAYTVSDTTKFKFDFAVANIPSPAGAVEDLKSFGAPYDPTVLHDPQKADRYKTEQLKALNLGIYNIDMAYAMLNDRGQDVLNYMKSVLYLGDQLGLRNALQHMVGNRAEANLNKRDSLFKLLDEIFVKSDTYLRNNERVYTASLIFAGSWIESLYLTCVCSENTSDETGRKRGRRLLWEQRFHLGNLLSVLGDYKDKPECAAMLSELKAIHSEISAVKQDAAMDDKAFSSISAKIAALRKSYTNG